VPLVPFPWQAWFAGKEEIVSPAIPGNAYLFDLSNNTRVGLNTPFSTVRFNISQSALDAPADERGLRRTSGPCALSLGCADAVMHGLAQTLVAATEQPSEGTSLFVQYVALAFHAHVLHTYGNVPVVSVLDRGGLALWQLRRAYEFIEVNLEGGPSVADIATECGLSSSYFTKVFKQTTGAPPHAWLSMKRIERAKQLMKETNLELAEIALGVTAGESCGPCGCPLPVDSVEKVRVSTRSNFLAPQVRFSDANVGDRIIHVSLNGDSSKSICGGNLRQSKMSLAFWQICNDFGLATFSTESISTGLIGRSIFQHFTSLSRLAPC
jgi:AraC-like DNA-binding protein